MSFSGSSSSSSSNPRSSSSETQWLYDVFLTFPAEYPSISSLESSLIGASIKTIIDYNEKISPKLLQAIERSRIVVVVFTKVIGDSRNFLDKLDVIMEYTGKMVLPIFWGVSQGEARQLISRLASEEDDLSKDDQSRRRRRLAEATSLVGRSVARRLAEATSLVGRSTASSSSARNGDIHDEIIDYIKMELNKTYLDIPRHVVGLQNRVNEVLRLSKYYSKDLVLRKENVIIVGIWGSGGIGKTTIAKAIYNTIHGNFEGQSFLENIKNVSEKDNGLVCLQEQLISNISYTKHEKILDVETGIRQMKIILHQKRALVVLDDVSQIDQLMALCGSREWFGAGSMILITTRNKLLLDYLKVKYVYQVKKMDKSESMEVFSWNAFKQSSPRIDFNNLAKRVITYCEGLPLILQVLGSLLFDRTIPEWQNVLEKLKSIPRGQIQEKLKISYEYLDYSIKDIFFNIACFYVGEEKQYVMQKLSGFKSPVEIGISMLIDWSLVKVDMYNKLDMHDLLQEIVKGINPTKSNPKYIYNVFLSFRGEDTRKSLATHLYVALQRAGVKVFMDNEIRRGEIISSSLTQAIECSRMSIIIFSINYAGSRWCLQELEKIMECHKANGQEVFPIFYGVQPSDVRKQIGSFGNTLERLIIKSSASKDKKLSWTRALSEAANLSGWDSNHYRTDAEMIDHVIETITMKVNDNMYLYVAHHPVGVKSRMQEIIQFLRGKSNEIIIVGIVGMGGIGKTTIAKAIYNEINQGFEGKSFLTNIREVWEQENGQVSLQEQLLSDVSQTRRVTLRSIELGKAIMKERLHHKRALVVLDDVNNMDQLNALCGSREWFGPGSRIIITTRDEHLLKVLQVDNVYNMKEMDDNESLELFSWHAFKQARPIEDFIELSTRVIAYSGGLPLALEVLGSYLFDRTVQAWESILDKLKEIPNDQIHKKLKLSYDGLSDDLEKDIFLDICCFFIGKDRNYVTKILDSCGLHAEIGITRLIERSLVKVGKNNKLDMHGLLRDMGKEIIREKSPEEPEKRTRLWFPNDVLDVLKNYMGTIAIKGLALNLSRSNTLSIDTIAFKIMKRLRLLQLGHVELDGNYEYLSKELRWLCWRGFPLKCMPENFYLGNAVAIDFKYSYLTRVWKKCQLLERLKILNLSHSHYLIQTPDFSKLPNLERLILKDCANLSSVDSSVGDLKYLIMVNLKDCKDLSHLPRTLYKVKSLKNLNLSGCSKIEKLEEDIGQMESLTSLQANETAITQVPYSLVKLKSINYVSLCGYEGLAHEVFPPLIQSWMSPTSNPRSLVQAFPSMRLLLQNLLHNFSIQSSGKLETRPSRSQISRAKTSSLIGFYDQVHIAEAQNFISSLTIQVGGFNEIIDALLTNISQGWSDRGLDCPLPGDNFPYWIAFEDEGSSVSFKVSQVIGHCLKGMVLCVIYLSAQDSMASIYPMSVMVKNFTKATIEFYKRDATTTSNDEEWHNIVLNLEPGNEVDVIVNFAHKYIVKKTAVYVVYDEEI